MNVSFLQGRLGSDPVVRFTKAGQAVANFPLATTQRFTNSKGEKQEKTQWHRVTCWGKQAEIVGQYLKKGRNVLVQGRIEYSEYTDKKSGEKRYSTSIVANQVTFLDSNKDQMTAGVETQEAIDIAPDDSVLDNAPTQEVGAGAAPASTDDDVPF